MTIEQFITKWYSLEKPEIRFKVTDVMIEGVKYDTVVFFIPKIDKWIDRNQKARFYDDCKRAGVVKIKGRKQKWYHKTW